VPSIQPRTVAGFCEDVLSTPNLFRKSSTHAHTKKKHQRPSNHPRPPSSPNPPPPTSVAAKTAGLPRGGATTTTTFSTSTTTKFKKVKYGHQLRKGILYENYRVLAPDGELLCTCSCAKVRWYVDRGLGTLEAADEANNLGPAVRLSFEPQGRRHPDDHYVITAKFNKCVKCGHDGDFVRHNVVPQVGRGDLL